jgi:hypothetical protein
MAFHVPHRFLDRLLPDASVLTIRYLLIGTFNPGLPLQDLMTDKEKSEVRSIIDSKQFKKIDAVYNFYDRPTNRLWGMLDRLHKPSLYNQQGNTLRNKNGLKYFAKLNREAVFIRQQAFCKEQGIFISDLIRAIEPRDLGNVYSQFKDTDLDNCVKKWNTDGLLKAIEIHNPIKIIFSFRESNAIPKISSEMRRIKLQHPEKVVSLLSPSGAAGQNYASLVADWKGHIAIS